MQQPTTNIQIRGFDLNDLEQRRINRRLQHLIKRLQLDGADPVIDLTLDWHPLQRRVTSRLRVRHAPIGHQLVADASSPRADESVRIATDRIERQLNRRLAVQRGEPGYRATSRRERYRSRRARALAANAEQALESADADVPEEEYAPEAIDMDPRELPPEE